MCLFPLKIELDDTGLLCQGRAKRASWGKLINVSNKFWLMENSRTPSGCKSKSGLMVANLQLQGDFGGWSSSHTKAYAGVWGQALLHQLEGP